MERWTPVKLRSGPFKNGLVTVSSRSLADRISQESSEQVRKHEKKKK